MSLNLVVGRSFLQFMAKCAIDGWLGDGEWFGQIADRGFSYTIYEFMDNLFISLFYLGIFITRFYQHTHTDPQ